MKNQMKTILPGNGNENLARTLDEQPKDILNKDASHRGIINFPEKSVTKPSRRPVQFNSPQDSVFSDTLREKFFSIKAAVSSVLKTGLHGHVDSHTLSSRSELAKQSIVKPETGLNFLKLERQIEELSSSLKVQDQEWQHSFFEYQEGNFSRIRDLNSRVSRMVEVYRELDSLRGLITDSFDSLSRKVANENLQLEKTGSTSSKTPRWTEHHLNELGAIHKDILSFRDFVSDWFKTAENNFSEIKKLSLRFQDHLGHLERISSNFSDTMLSIKNSTPLSAEALDKRMQHFEQQFRANSRRFRWYENIFYGIVIIQLLLISAVLVWWKVSPP